MYKQPTEEEYDTALLEAKNELAIIRAENSLSDAEQTSDRDFDLPNYLKDEMLPTRSGFFRDLEKLIQRIKSSPRQLKT